MNSSISSFSQFSKVLAFVGAVLLVTEIANRFVILPRSGSYSTISKARQESQRLAPDKESAVVIGNSFTIRGVDTNQLEETCDSSGYNVKLYANSGSKITEWYWMFRLNFLNQENAPNHLVLNAGQKTLFENGVLDHRRLALIFGPNSLPLIPNGELQVNQKQLEFLLARYSMTINMGRDIGERIQTKLIPNFQASKRELARRINSDQVQSSETHSQETGTLKRLLEECQKNSIRCLIVLMPHLDPYEIDEELLTLLRSSSAQVIDHSQVKELSSEHFRDAVHLNETGREIYSPIYIKSLLEYLENSQVENPPANYN